MSVSDPSKGGTARATEIEHEDCATEGSGAQRLDANRDGSPDVTLVFDSNKEVCRAVDLNFDGVVDAWIYRDAAGNIRRRESDYDRDGRIDEVAVYQGGVLVQRHSSTTLAHKLDTWQFFESGALTRAERDSDGDNVIDQWWEYPNEQCPLMHADINNDGRPDLGATLDYCKETGYVPPRRSTQARASSPDFSTETSMPTEVETRPMDSASEGSTAGQPADKKGAP